MRTTTTGAAVVMLRRTMPQRPSSSRRKQRPNTRPTLRDTAIVTRFSRSDGRFDLPTVAGRTAKQIARRLA